MVRPSLKKPQQETAFKQFHIRNPGSSYSSEPITPDSYQPHFNGCFACWFNSVRNQPDQGMACVSDLMGPLCAPWWTPPSLENEDLDQQNPKFWNGKQNKDQAEMYELAGVMNSRKKCEPFILIPAEVQLICSCFSIARACLLTPYF